MRLKPFACLALFAWQLYALTWLHDVDQALAIGAKENKPVLVYFTGHWNTWCQKLEAQVMSQSAFEKLGTEMILTKLSYPQDRKDYTKNLTRYKQTYQVYSYPTLIILGPDGSRLGSVGYPRDSVDEYIARIRFLAKINDQPIVAPSPDKKALDRSKAESEEESLLIDEEAFPTDAGIGREKKPLDLAPDEDEAIDLETPATLQKEEAKAPTSNEETILPTTSD